MRTARLFALAASALALVVLAAACSHRTAFIRRPAAVAAAPPWSVDHRLILIGDAGDANPEKEPALDLLQARVQIAPKQTTVVFLGDNVYENGMPVPSPGATPCPERAPKLEGPVAALAKVARAVRNLTVWPKVAQADRCDAERRLLAQIRAAHAPGARVIFVPGNHDWAQFGTGNGLQQVRAQEAFIDQQQEVFPDIELSMMPRRGCPGPVPVDLGHRGSLVVLDTQWWFETESLPSATDCDESTEHEALAALENSLARAAQAKRAAVVVGHHPIDSAGPHAGFIEDWVHLFPLTMLGGYLPPAVEWFPLPGLGTLAGVLRATLPVIAQDFSHPKNRDLRQELSKAMQRSHARGAGALVYAAGHDHSLQVIRPESGPRWTLVSGLGSSRKASGVYHSSRTRFAHAHRTMPGLMEIEFLTDGRARLAVVEWRDAKPAGEEVYSAQLTAAR